MAYRFLLVAFVITVLLIQLCRGRYCQEAVNSVQIVESCPTSKTEWDAAARKKNCSRIALQQDCSPVEQFQYHCVINGYRNETLEVCAPTRIIFGHCVEFNVPGGVVQDQLSTPCNEIFPKCDGIYNSMTAYKYPDCYQLVSNNKSVSITTTIQSIPNDGLNKDNNSVHFFIVGLFCFTMLLLVACTSVYMQRRLFTRKMAFMVKTSHQSNESKRKESRGLLQIFKEQNGVLHTDQAKDAPGTQPEEMHILKSDCEQGHDASDNHSEELSTVQSDSDIMCDTELPTRDISPAPSSFQSASSGSTVFEDASEGRSDDPDDLQPNSGKLVFQFYLH